MHLIVPFAAPLPGPARDAAFGELRTLALPNLQRLLAGRAPAARDEGDAMSLSAPHERALARALGWAGADGALPLAAWLAARDGIDPGDLAWGLLTPAHLHVGTEQVSLLDPAALQLDEAGSRELLDIVRPLFETEGFATAWGAPLRWYVAHESLADLPTASIDRVVGRHIDPWLPPLRTARLAKRLQNEVQMLLYTHAVNERREAAGELTVNSFWLSGCGRAQAAHGEAVLDERLRGPAVAEDGAAWRAAWQALDAEVFAGWLAQPAPRRLTLCGERASATFELGPRTAWAGLRARFAPRGLHALLESL